jgi:predicted MFS family arabinose efflux permease
VTATQVGYALGIFLVVPLGDVLDRRKLVPGILCGAAAMLLGAALAPTYATLLASLAGVGLTTVSAQLLAPLASELAEPGQRGRVVGTISAGGLTGILASRTVSGVVADLLGWRAIYAGAAVAALLLAIVLRVVLPPLARRGHIPYPRLLASVFTTISRHPAVAPTLAICAANFAVFSLFWTSLTYLLSAPPFSYDTGRIGLFGLAGLAGALGARRAGGLHDRGWSVPASGAAFLLLALALVTAWAARTSPAGLVVAVILLDLAVQANLVLGQTRLMSLPGDARSRLNTAMVVSSFGGGAAGSLAAGPLWAGGGWPAVVAAALCTGALGFLVWVASRRTRLAVAG